ncbi:Uncharacterized GMC-type oxidoreductase in thcA 5'region [Geodia barretti]|uniref:Uncharacterized GMC-type oxidoreductase in thcA 5'region n=1 Tax=Geodia barretti TaxID=519541 RepID=A0AA35QSH6_GEOBA|nr:Uncharacterized GMC-type oxidoreductase in thcA 5'region [Geodia barretti]
MGNDQWSFQNLLGSFRRLETDTDFSDDFHGNDGPIIARRFKPEDWLPAQSAFYSACKAYGFPDSPDHNSPDASGIGPTPFNNPNGIRWSTALGYLDPARHRLNLTIRPNCTVHRIMIEGNRAIGAVVESGGDIFTVEGDQIILSGGAIASPQLLMLSGVGPADHLRSHGIPVVNDLPGVGQNLRDHPIVPHISCTCKMGPSSDPMAVVDQFGKVHGLDGIRVVDASIMPDCIRANTNVTTMMIGERVSEFMLQGS